MEAPAHAENNTLSSYYYTQQALQRSYINHAPVPSVGSAH